MLERSRTADDATDQDRGVVLRALIWLRYWPYTFGVGLAIVSGVTVLVASQRLGRPILDPDGFLGPSYIRLPMIVVLFFAADVVPRALARTYTTTLADRGSRGVGTHVVAALQSIRRIGPASVRITREQWTWVRLLYVSVGGAIFYVCYVSYRNLKSYLPLIIDRRYDTELDKLDAFLMFGTRPSLFLHDILGTSFSAHILSALYIGYLVVVPISLAAMLVWSQDISLGAWYATAMSLNWMLGVASYYMLPTLGPGIQYPQYVWELPDTGVSALQHSLTMARNRFVSDLDDPTSMQGVAGFASLHVSVVFTACLIFQRLGYGAWLRWAAWAFFVATVLSTLYFGWHYIADDIGGLAVGWLSVVIAAKVTGQPNAEERRETRRDRPGPALDTA